MTQLAPAPNRIDPRVRKNYHLLVVDDEKTVLEVIHDMIVAQGYQSVATHSPVEALQKIKRQKFDAIILDVYMPEMSGMLFHAKLRVLDPELFKRTIFISGYVSRDDLRAHLSSTSAFLEKPFKARELLEVVEKTLPDTPRNGSS